jgi:hypothetical protein
VALSPPFPGLRVLEQDRVALAEIELCGELMIAASAADEERMSTARIDEVLKTVHVPVPVPVPD